MEHEQSTRLSPEDVRKKRITKLSDGMKRRAGIGHALLYALTDFEFLKVGPLSVWTPWLLLIVPALEIPLFLFLTAHRMPEFLSYPFLR